MGDSCQEADRYLIEMLRGQPIRTDERGGYRGRGKGVTPFIISYLYVIGFSLLALKTMVTTNFNKRLLIEFLSVTVFIFFLLPGGHLITIIPKLLGSLGVRAIAGEVGEQHIEKYSFSLAVVALVITLGITMVVGRALCGYGCPVGAVQELFYEIPTGKNGEGKLIVPTKLTFFIRIGYIVSAYWLIPHSRD
ncbi:MAG: 4Fe-4S binding protein [Candidatus Korarchaeota archaeon]|nr:4Fe-4S binding protein [Candidatus Korarchaeota archaeon]NIU84200.1 4Fe-4S binding protein [Candidatus Thorarchaeota archaeon]NIW14348.1 4Fe-4S binding protein [Candidatus Thorarchaeota archaeon]NIW52437.1 4Fe-4S binding protein [Candidatus Korarchaeota archaeon]